MEILVVRAPRESDLIPTYEWRIVERFDVFEKRVDIQEMSEDEIADWLAERYGVNWWYRVYTYEPLMHTFFQGYVGEIED